MKIIITMAGLGSRFREIGVDVSKHEIIAKGKTLFEWSVSSLRNFFSNEFLFIVRKGGFNEEFIKEKCKTLGLNRFRLIVIKELTDGQATTALYADKYINDDEQCIIYNIDTYVEPEVLNIESIDKKFYGFIPVFVAEGNNWSFVKVDNNNNVIDVAEKRQISNLATIGFYYFRSWKLYKEVYNNLHNNVRDGYKEVYIAPLYKKLIEDEKKIGITVIDKNKIHVLGTPNDIENFEKNYRG